MAPPATPFAAPAGSLLDFAVLQSPAVFYLASLEGERPLHFVSANIEPLLGFPAELFMREVGFGRRLLHPEDWTTYQDAIDGLLRNGEVRIDYRLRHADGQYRWIRDWVRLLPPEEGRAERRFVGCMLDVSGEKAAETRLRESVGLTETLLANAFDAVVSMDEDGVVLGFNPAAERMFGWRRDEAIGRPLADLIVPPESRERHREGLERMRRGDAPLASCRRLQVEAQRKDGTRFPVELTIAGLRQGRRHIFVGEIRDISERVEAQAERARLSRLLEAAVASLPAAFCMTDADDRLLLCNEIYAEAFGRKPHELIGLRRRDTVRMLVPMLHSFDGHPLRSDAHAEEDMLNRLRGADREPVEIGLKDGRWMLIWGTRTSEGNIIHVRTDITATKRAEASVLESHAVVRQVLEACPVPIGMTRAADSQVLYESPASKALFGRDPDVADAFAIDGFADPADRELYLAALRERGQVDEYEVRMRRSDGSEFQAALSARLVEFRGEEVIVCSTFDLTERRELEAEMERQREALHQNEKLAAMGSLLAGVAHELNNPLSVVVGQALLMRETAVDAGVKDRAEKIGRAADRCARIVKSFLAMARQRPQSSRAVKIGEVVSQALELTGYSLRASGVDVRVRVPAELPEVWGDADQLVQVLTNLIVNAEQALKGNPEKRCLTITASHRPTRGELALKVKDNGPGIPQELQRRIFEPFFTTKEVGEGTGIGLAFCHRVIESHRGRIKLESGPGAGASFAIVLPTAGLRAGPAKEPASAAEPTGRPHALVIDDEPEVAEVVETILERDGFRVTRADSGAAALTALSQQSFDVILSDLRMPGLDGCRLFDHLAAERPDLLQRLGFVTGDTVSPDARRFLERAQRPVVEKPISPQDIRTLVRRLLPERLRSSAAE